MKTRIILTMMMISAFFTNQVLANTLQLSRMSPDSDNLSLGIDDNGELMCNWNEAYAQIKLLVTNEIPSLDDFEAVRLDDIETTEVEYQSISQEVADLLNFPVTPDEHTYYVWAGRMEIENSHLSTQIKKYETRTLDVKFELPDQDGFYQEVLEAFWLYPSQADKEERVPQRTESFIYYEVRDGCVRFVSADDFISHVFPTKQISGFNNGALVTMNDIEGYAEALTDNVDASAVSEVFLTPDSFGETGAFQFYSDESAAVSVSSSSSSSSSGSAFTTTSATSGTGRTYKLCVKIQLRHDYNSPPQNTTGMGWWYPEDDQLLHNFNGIRFEVWDRDFETSDDYIGTWTLRVADDQGYGCLFFYWDKEKTGENYPDVYIRTEYEVMDPNTSSRIGEFCASSSDCNSGITWRHSYIDNFGSQGENTHYISRNFGAADSWNNRLAMIMNSLQKFFWRSKGKYMTNNIKVKVPRDGDDSFCGSKSWITIGENNAPGWTTPVHEAGHAYQNQLFDYVGNDTCPNPHYMHVPSNMSCALSEGWAEFVAVSSWYDDVPGVDPRYDRRDPATGELIDIENGIISSDHNTNREIEAMACKAFWDMFDSQEDTELIDGHFYPEGVVYDTSDVQIPWSVMANIWRKFPWGYGDGENRERDMDIWDYIGNAKKISISTMLDADAAVRQNRQDYAPSAWCGDEPCEGSMVQCCMPQMMCVSADLDCADVHVP